MRVELTGDVFGNSTRAQIVVEWTVREGQPEIVSTVRDAFKNETSLVLPMWPWLTWRVRSIAHESGREVKAIVAQLRVSTIK